MSAVAGLWHRDGKAGDGAQITAMLAALRHYGPDGSAVCVEGAAAFGHCRMSLCAADERNVQPVSFAEGRMHLVADIRLDNRDELATAFGMSKTEGDGLSDARMLALCYERWGADCLQHILGDYSFAVWDKAERSWLLARDPVGSLPLYYFVSSQLFAFASMPLGLLALQDVPCAPNDEWIAQMLEGVPRPPSPGVTGETFFRDIRRVPAGHFVRIQAERQTVHRYWAPPVEELRLRTPPEYHEALREQMDRAVARRLPSSGDLACHLSGGLDSSSVVATAARLQQRRSAKVVAYTAIPQVPVAEEAHNRFADEREHASSVARLYHNVDHVLLTSQGRSPWSGLGNAFHLYQQPLLNTCNMAWTTAIQDDAAARNLHVLLAGNMGNHTISYTGLEMLPDLAASHRWAELWNLMTGLHRRRGMAWKSLAARTFAPLMPQGLHAILQRRLRPAHERAVPRHSLLHVERQRQRKSLPQASLSACSGNSMDSRLFMLQRTDSAALRKGTLAGWRLDERDPTADRRLIEFCLRVPATEYLRGGMPSALLRDGFADRLPPLVRNETRKGLQGTDWHLEATRDLSTLQGLVEEFAGLPAVTQTVDVDRLRAMIDAWPQDGWSNAAVVQAYRHSLLRSVSIAAFLRDVEKVGQHTGRGAV